MNVKETEIISNWIEKCLKLSDVDNDSDLHLDEISSHFEDNSTWLHGSLEVIFAANKITNNFNNKVKPVLYFPLKSYDKKAIGINFDSYYDIQNQFSITPPSLLLASVASIKELRYLVDRKLIEAIGYHGISIEVYFYEKYHSVARQYCRNLSLLPQ